MSRRPVAWRACRSMEKKHKPPQAFKRFEQHAHELRAMATKFAILLNGGAAGKAITMAGMAPRLRCWPSSEVVWQLTPVRLH